MVRWICAVSFVETIMRSQYEVERIGMVYLWTSGVEISVSLCQKS